MPTATSSKRLPPLRYHAATWPLLALSLLALLLVTLAGAALAGGVIWLWSQALQPLDIGRLLWALVAISLAGIWLAPCLDRPLQPRGLWVTPTDAPELFRLIREAWRRAGIPGTPRIDLTADASLRLAPPPGIGGAIVGQQRVLQVGIGLVNELTAEELVSLLAATASEWGSRGYAIGGFVHRVALGLEAYGGVLGAGGCIQMLNPLYWLTAMLAQLLQRQGLLRQVAWQRPLFADAAGVAAAGSVIYYAAVEKASLNEAIFESTGYNIVFDLMEQGKQLKNLFQYYTEHKATIEPISINMLRDAVFSAPGQAGASLPAGIELPTLSQRLARVMQQPYQESFAAQPARELLPDIARWEERLTEGLTTGLDRALQTAREELWQESQLEIATMKDEYEHRNPR